MTDPDFDGLVEASWNAQNKLGEQAVWRATLGLSRWYFVLGESGEDPMFGAVEGRPYLIAFTDEPRAEAFAARLGEQRQSDPPGVVHMDVPDAVAYIEGLKDQGVDGVLFNSGGFSYQAGCIAIADMHRRGA